MALVIGYSIYDLNTGKRMAAEACRKAKEGMPLEEYLSDFSKEEYKIIRGEGYVMVVPVKGMGRSHCMVEFENGKITGVKTGFMD